MKREFTLLEDSAKTRYVNLMREQPELIENIPLNTWHLISGLDPNR
ncbi:hypothetical protein KUH03_32415 [Sphingobacterium sp. E70]|nr:hypothetical protein [Sphingobacterium sp. E70]ULT23805.1 hypothetical protein KUH03_32415 [Sphingobacterium sp. E70]